MCDSLHIMTTDEIISTITQKRRQLGISQAALANLAGISRRTMVAIESGEHDVGIRKLQRILDSLGLTMSVIDGPARPIESELSSLFRDEDE